MKTFAIRWPLISFVKRFVCLNGLVAGERKWQHGTTHGNMDLTQQFKILSFHALPARSEKVVF